MFQCHFIRHNSQTFGLRSYPLLRGKRQINLKLRQTNVDGTDWQGNLDAISNILDGVRIVVNALKGMGGV
jgi:hypothetical protein